MDARFQGHDIITSWAFTTILRSYKMTGDMIKSGKILRSYMPEDIISYKNFDFIGDRINENISFMDSGKKQLLKMVKDVVSKDKK